MDETLRPKMKPEFRARWLQACSDGSYYQVQGYLMDSPTSKYRCCLGVAYAIGLEMNLFEPADRKLLYAESKMLTLSQAEALGIMDQEPFAKANDTWAVDGVVNDFRDGYYPQWVLDLIRNHPVEGDSDTLAYNKVVGDMEDAKEALEPKDEDWD